MINKVIVIVGPTATSKTKLAIRIAQTTNGEIVNADAFQVYKELNIGVNKPTSAQLKQVKFHLINNISVTNKWDIKKFKDKASGIIKHLIEDKKIPIIVGGSHLYIDALIRNYDLSSISVRDEQFDNLTNKELFDKLSIYDHKKAMSIIGNRQRLTRALQIYSQAHSTSPMNKKNKPLYDPLVVFCNDDRHSIYKRINERVDSMLSRGWVEEVKQITSNYSNAPLLNALKAIGYKEIAQALSNGTPIPTETIKQKTRQYAKRQLTWIKHHYESPIIFNQTNEQEVLNKVKLWLNTK